MKECIIFLLMTFVCIDGQVFGGGKCPTVETQKTFDIKKYMGIWYEIEKFPASFESRQKCNTANYTLLENGHIDVVNTGIGDNGSSTRAEGDGFIPDEKEPAKLSIKFAAAAPYGKYWILDTDYETYTLIYSCTDLLGVGNIQFAWILARERTLSDDIIKKLEDEMTSFKIKIDPFEKADQTDCS